MNNDIVYQVTSYIKNNSSPCTSKPTIVPIKELAVNYTMVCFKYRNKNVDVFIYNPNFIYIKINTLPFAFCDNIKTFRKEIDRMHATQYE